MADNRSCACQHRGYERFAKKRPIAGDDGSGGVSLEAQVYTTVARVSGLCVYRRGSLEHEVLEVDWGYLPGPSLEVLVGQKRIEGAVGDAIRAKVIYAHPARKPACLQGRRDGNARACSRATVPQGNG